ncbi:MAG: polysaccharide biosynthesis protein [Ruminococcaceae bacterium]|nr:polysaccharide biosynthesis protein [Oscillospiraceae bacterium]
MILSVLVDSQSNFIGNLVKYSITIAIWFGITCVFYLMMYYVAGMHRVLWKFAGGNEYIKLSFVIVSSSLFSLAAHSAITRAVLQKISVGAYFIEILLALFLILMSHAMIRYNHRNHRQRNDNCKNVMIIGCGSSGNMVANEFFRAADSEHRVVCFIDDNPSLTGRIMNNIPIVGTRDSIQKNALKYNISLIIFAIPSLNSSEKAKILELCVKTGCEVKTVPSISQILSGESSPYETRSIDIDDLLGRDPIKVDLKKVMDYVSGKTILVTGGGGSIGSELCRQIASHNPKKLIIFDIYENSAYEIQNELKNLHPELDLITLIGSVRDSSRVDLMLDKYKPDIIYHAAAHKHVPLMEDSPNEAIKNNVLGTYKLVRAADKHDVKRFVMISTDKAVNPTNIMGATKRICEMIIQSFNKHSKCEYVAVRFGNVLGSNGSVIPLFKKQIENGGPVTVTHPDIIRYFMTIPEAVSLVLQAGAFARGGEIFVLDMGQPVKIVDLARNLITLMGHVPDGDIKIEFTGLRPGEKLYEELLMAEEGLTQTENERIHIGHPLEIDENELVEVIDKLVEVMYDDFADVRSLVKRLVPTYHYEE